MTKEYNQSDNLNTDNNSQYFDEQHETPQSYQRTSTYSPPNFTLLPDDTTIIPVESDSTYQQHTATESQVQDHVTYEEAVQSEPYGNQDTVYTTYHQQDNNKKGKKRYKGPLLVLACLLAGGAGGVGGAYLINSMGEANSQTVIYQNVEKRDESGNTVTQMSVKQVVQNTSNSVVEITTESASNDSYFQQYVTKGAGSGVIISKDGYIVTNHHVIEGASKITIRTKDGTEYTAKLIGSDEKTDLAVLKIEATELHAAVLGSSSNLSVGEEAIAIGNPLGELGGTVTQGIISALDREINIDGQSMTLLQTDTAINKGNSGGGLFNNNGELIGIVNAKSSGSSVEGLGFAIPIDTAKPVIESIIKNGYVSGRPMLGVSMANITDETSAFQAGVNDLGVYVAKITYGSAAEEAGLQVKDRFISVDGQNVTSSSEIAKIIDGKNVGDTITIVVNRNGTEITVKAKLKEAEQNNAASSNNNNNYNNGNGYNNGENNLPRGFSNRP